MAEHSLGVIIPGGAGRKRATSNQDDPTAALWAYSYRVQHWPGNTGTGSVGDSALEMSTGQGTFGFLPPPNGAVGVWPIYESPTVDDISLVYNMADVYIDSDDPTDGFLVTYMEK